MGTGPFDRFQEISRNFKQSQANLADAAAASGRITAIRK